MKEVVVDGVPRQVPQKWDELTREQFLEVCKQFYFFFEKSEVDIMVKEYEASRLMVLKSIMQLTTTQLFIMQATPEVYYDIYPLMDFLRPTKEKPIDLKENHIRVVRVGRRKYHGPYRALRGSTLEELTTADTAFVKYSQHGRKADLYRFIACLYRKPKRMWRIRDWFNNYDGDSRQRFNGKRIAKRAKKFEKQMPKEIATGVIYFYWAFRENQLLKTYSDLFQSSGKKSKHGWSGVILELAGDKFGTVKQTGQSPWINAFKFLQMEKEKADEMERKRKSKLS